MKTELKIGKKYGKWTVVNFDCVDSRRRRRYFCKCDCGIEKSLIASGVASGLTKSCPRCKRADLTGRQFGLWTVVNRSGDQSTGSGYRTLWLCRCTCGKEHLVERCNLVKGGSRGCWICQRNVLTTEYFPRAWYRKLIEQAKLRKHEFNLSEKELWDVWESQLHRCVLTDLELVISEDELAMTASVDRIDNKKGYIKDNVWFIHKHINIMKFRYNVDYFVEMCNLVSQNKKEING